MIGSSAAVGAPRDLSAFTERPAMPEIEPREMQAPPTAEEMREAYRAAHPRLSPQEALASNAELGPAYDGPKRADNHVSNIHTEIQVNGKTIARVYNSGAIEIADEYGFITDELHESFANDRIVGPDLAEARAERFKAALQRHGVLPKEELDADGLMAATLAKTPVVELLRASTAQTQEEWLEEKAKEEPMPGALFERTA